VEYALQRRQVEETEQMDTNKETVHGVANIVRDEEGAVGYIFAWLLGVPASVLFLIFLVRGCN
jgi:hypothetical protein